MSLNVPVVGQAFIYPARLEDAAGALITDPSSVYTSGDVTGFFGTSATEVTLSSARRGSTPILDITISAGNHTDSPVVIQIRDRNGSAFKTQWIPLFTDPNYQVTADDDYVYVKNSGGTVLRHAPILLVSGETKLGPFVEGTP